MVEKELWLEPFMNHLVAEARHQSTASPYGAAQPLERGSNNYYFIIKVVRSMDHISAPPPSCRSVFRDSDTPLTTQRYTEIWIQLINQLERSSAAAAGLQ